MAQRSFLPALLLAAALATLGGPAAAAVMEDAPDPAEGRRFALVVGANQGGEGRSRLRFAVRDARAMADVLAELGGVAREDLALLEDPDVETLVGTLAGFSPRMAASTAGRRELLVYYSGHSDETGLLLGEERFGYRELRAAVDDLPAEVRIVVLDSCASGNLTRLKGGLRTAPFLVDAASKVTGHAFLTSASADEAAQESDGLGASFFTHYLISGMRGAADLGGDGKVTLNEAYQYAFHETLRRTEGSAAGPQHASYDIRLAGTGDLVITDLRVGAADLRFADDVRGRLFVRQAGGPLLAELPKPGAGERTLSVPPGDYEVRLDDGEGMFGARLQIEPGERRLLARAELAPVALEPTASRGPAEAVGLAELRDIGRLRESGHTMMYGGLTTAVLGGCCASLALPPFFVASLDGGSNTDCLMAGGACTVLGVLLASFGLPVAFVGRNRLSEADELERSLDPEREAGAVAY